MNAPRTSRRRDADSYSLADKTGFCARFPKLLRLVACFVFNSHSRMKFMGYDLRRSKKYYTCRDCGERIITSDPEAKNAKR